MAGKRGLLAGGSGAIGKAHASARAFFLSSAPHDRLLPRTPASIKMDRSAGDLGFVDSLQEPRTPYISLKRLSQAFGMKVANLAQLTGVSIATRSAIPPRSDCTAECARWSR